MYLCTWAHAQSHCTMEAFLGLGDVASTNLSCRLLSCRLLSCPVMSSRVMSSPIMSCHFVSCHVLSCHVVSCHVVSCPVLSCRVVSSPVFGHVVSNDFGFPASWESGASGSQKISVPGGEKTQMTSPGIEPASFREESYEGKSFLTRLSWT